MICGGGDCGFSETLRWMADAFEYDKGRRYGSGSMFVDLVLVYIDLWRTLGSVYARLVFWGQTASF